MEIYNGINFSLAGLLYILLGCCSRTFSEVTYHGDQVLTVSIEDLDIWDGIQKLGLDVWRLPDHTQTADVRVEAPLLPDTLQYLRMRDIPYIVRIPDVQRLVDRERREMRRIKRSTNNPVLGIYAKYEPIMAWMEQLARDNPDIVKQETIGKTYEGRDMKLLQIGVPGENKLHMWIEANIHSREWITTSTAVYIIHQLIEGYKSGDETIREYLTRITIHMMPVGNPDGFVYSHNEDRLWRKNRRPLSVKSGQQCFGVDLNRNWAYKWGGANANDIECDRMYLGPRAMSEPEVQHMARYIQQQDGMVAYLALHSYSQVLLSRWSYTWSEVPADHDELMSLALRVAGAITETHNVPYAAGTAPSLLYPYAGGSADWARGVAKVKYSYTLELRDNGTLGFILPPENIIPTGEETWAGLKVILAELVKNGRDATIPDGPNLPVFTTAKPDGQNGDIVDSEPYNGADSKTHYCLFILLSWLCFNYFNNY